MNIKPLQDRIVVQRTEEEAKTAGGIVLPDSAKEKPAQGKVVAVGPGKLTETGKNLPMSLKIGDKVLFNKYSGNEIKVDDQEYLIMNENDVLATIN